MELVLEIKSLLLEACVGFPLLLSLVSTRCCFSFLIKALVVVVFLDSQKNSYEQWNIIVLIDLQCSFMTINLYRSLIFFTWPLLLKVLLFPRLLQNFALHLYFLQQ